MFHPDWQTALKQRVCCLAAKGQWRAVRRAPWRLRAEKISERGLPLAGSPGVWIIYIRLRPGILHVQVEQITTFKVKALPFHFLRSVDNWLIRFRIIQFRKHSSHTSLLHSCLDGDHSWMASTQVQPSLRKAERTQALPPTQETGLGDQL